MSKISTYEVAPVPKLSDKLIGTSVGGEIEDVTYNFTLQELLDVFLPVIPANNLQGILDYGNTATQDINLFGTITTTNLEVTDTANLFITYLNEETHIVGSLYDSADSIGTAGQVLTSTGDGVEWFTLPPIFTPNLQQVLEEGNTADLDIILDADLEAINIAADTANIATQLSIQGVVVDYNESPGTAGQVLESTVTGVQWTNLPVYSATSPLLFNSGTNTFSIQVANSTQGGYLTASDWVTFDGKQNAGAYITALTGEATATGPGSVPITLNNASVIAKVLTGLNVTGGSISASDSILTAFGKVQSQINGLMGGVQYQGVWNASTNTPTLTSSVGTQGHYYIVNVAGTTNLNGITDWQIGDWAIFSGGAWQKVDNTESVTSVNGQTGAVSLTTDNIPEGATNLYYLDSRARGALSFAAGSGAYNSLTGVITIPTNNNQILNGANYITLGSLSASSPLVYNNLTGAFSIPQATSLVDGYLSATDWSTFNSKQNYLGGTGLVKSTAGTITYITDNSSNWNTAYNRSIVSASVTGTTTKTLTLNEQDGNTIQASWTDLDTGLTSVGVSMPAAFSVANSPLTSNGTIAITGAGTTLQYIDGTGALQTFPGLTGFVPYTGATQNVDLGEYGISAGYFQADLTPSGALQVGRMQWNSTDGTMDLRLLGNNVTLQIGQENVTRVVNKSGIDLLEANYQVVRVRKVAEGGAQGQRLAVVLAQGNNENNSTEVLGLVTETINANQEGFVTAFGEVKNINTTGSLQGETWVDGDILYLSSTVAGQLTNVRPVAPNHAVIVGYVTYAHANNGKIYMAIDTGYELGELHNVYAPSPTNNQSIYWNSTNSRYQLNTIGGILGYTPANAATLISTTAPLQGGGDLSANRTFSITQAGASTDGYLSSTDWNTFNNKQPAGSYVPTSRLLSINGTQYDLSADRSWSVGTVTSVAALTLGTSGTDLSSSVANGTTTPVITLNVPTASAANRGALSAADWSTFNTKVGGVTASSPLASSGGQTPNITIQQASGSQDGYLSSTDWTTFNNKQAAGNYITSLTGEATASGPGAAAVTLNNASVTGKVLTGVNITGGSISATDSILTAFGKVQNQINGLIGSTIYQGTWNASTNTPALASGVGVRGYYYIVSVAGTTNLDGITDWFVGDWAIFDGTAWQQVDNTDAVVSVNGQTGAVSLTTDNIPEGATNQYFLNSRARAALSFTAGSGAYNSTTGVITIPTNTSQLTNGANFITLASLSGTAPIQYNNSTGVISITQAGTASNGFLSSTDWNTFNNKQSALTNPVTGTGTTNYLAKFTGTSTIGDSNILIQGGGFYLAGSEIFTNANGGIFFNGNGSYATGIFGYSTSNNIRVIAPNQIDFYTASTQRMLLDASGNLGLGVTPSAWSVVTGLQVLNANISSVGGNTNNSNFGSNFYYDGTNFRYIGTSFATNLKQLNGGFEFYTAPSGTAGNAISFTQAMTLNASGNLSIGNTNDTYKLDVTGTARFTGQVTSETQFYAVATPPATNGGLINVRDTVTATNVTSFAGVFFNSSPGSDYSIGKLTENGTGYLQIRNANNGSELLRIASTGAATFSSSVTANARSFIKGSAGYLFDVEEQSSNKARFQSYVASNEVALIAGYDTTAVPMTFYAGGSERMRITSGGNVSIGNTNDTYKLDVTGTARVTSNLLAQKVQVGTAATINDATGVGNTLQFANYSAGVFVTGSADSYIYKTSSVFGGLAAQTLIFQTRSDVSGGGFAFVGGSTPSVIAKIDQTGAATFSSLAGSGTRIVVADANGTLSASSALSGYISGSGTTNYLPKFTGTSTIGNSDLITDASGNLAVAQGNAPTQALNLYRAGSTQTVMAVGNSNTGLNGTYFGVDANGNGIMNTTGAFANIFSTNGSERMRLNASGNLSIGNTNDTYKLDVSGTGRFTGQVTIKSGNGNQLLLDNAGERFTQMYFFNNNTYKSAIWWDNDTSKFEFYTGVTALSIASTGAATFSSSVTAGGDVTLSGNESYLYFTSTYLVGSNTRAKIRTVGAGGGSGYGGDLRFSTRNSSNVWNEDAMTINSSGFVGIGTTSPTSKLHVSSSDNTNAYPSTASINISNYDGGAFGRTMGVNFSIGSGVTSEFLSGVYGVYTGYGSSVAGALSFITNNGSGSFAERMRITSSGSVGIGTSSPSTLLYVNGYTASNWITTIYNTGTSGHQMYFGYNDGSTTRYGLYIDGGQGSGSSNFDLAVANKFYVMSGGNVGIGTTSPNRNLVVDGGSSNDAYLKLNISSTSASLASGILFNNNLYGDGSMFIRLVGNSSQLNYNTAGTHAFTGGNVGIGTTSPADILDVTRSSASNSTGGISLTNTDNSGYGAALNWNLKLNSTAGVWGRVYAEAASSTATFMSFQTTVGGTLAERMRINSAGNVGIGTTSPSYKLDVNGSFSTVTSSIYLQYNSGILYHVGGSGDYYQYISGANYLLYNRTATGALTFGTQDTERMRITSGGQVLIAGSSANGSPIFQIDKFDSNTNSSTYFWNTYTSGMMIRNSSTTTNTLAPIYFYMGSSNNSVAGIAGIQESSTLGAIGFFTGGSGLANTVPERMRITSGGQILMGTTAAQSGTRLQVAGGFLDVWSTANTLLRLNHDGSRGVIESFTGGAYSNTSINPDGGSVLVGSRSSDYGKLDVTVSPSSYTAALGLGLQTNSGEGNSVGISFKTKISLSGAIWENARIAAFTDAVSSSVYGALAFYTMNATTLSERMRIGNNGFVGIGVVSPAYKLEVNSSTGDNHIAAVGTAPSLQLMSANSGPANWATIGMATTTNNFITGSVAGDFCIANRGTTAGNMLFGFSSSEKMRLTSNGDLCINATATTASAKLYVNGTAAFGSVYVASLGTGTVYSNGGTLTNTNPSDRRLKTNIIPLTYGLSDILKLNPVSYNWKDGTNGKQFGFIAQDVQEIMPDAVKNGEYLGLEKDAIYSALVNAIKEQQVQINELKSQLK